jgi:hypothetical protein
MKKPFKETKLGNLLQNKLPDALALVGNVLPDNGVLGVVKNLIDSSTLTSEEKKELQKEVINYEIELSKLHNEELANARNMQVEALKQDDVFSKRFNYYLAGGSILLGFVYLFAVTFLAIPTDSQRFADIGFGVISTVVFGQIYSFFYGSSQSSKHKDTVISNLKK